MDSTKKIISSIILIICIVGQGITQNSMTNEQKPRTFNEMNHDDSFIYNKELFQSPDSSVILENSTLLSKQLINDSSFDLNQGSPWKTEIIGDQSDLSSNLENNNAEYTLIGDKRTYSDVNSQLLSSDWTDTINPDFPVLPDFYEINSNGLNVSHEWDEEAEQSPSIHWYKNVTMPVNMSDYVITSASLQATVNATVHATPGGWLQGGLECPGDSVGDSGTQYGTYDYVRFYVLISDRDRFNEFEIAYLQTVDLGQDDLGSGAIPTLADTFLTNIPEETLILYLTSVLSRNYFDFTITLGMRLWCEDNWPSDSDYWDTLLIKNFSLEFDYEKKINQFSELSFFQSGYKLNDSEYIDKEIEIKNATLYFDYNVSQNWPVSSPNSRLSVSIFDLTYSDDLYLSTMTIAEQSLNDGKGFDISSLFSNPNNFNNYTSIKIQLYIADNFHLDQNISISIDNVNLTVWYNVIESREPIETSLNTIDGRNNYNVIWNSTKRVTLNYTELNPLIPINESVFSINWVDSNSPVLFMGNGIYEFDINTSSVSAGLSYILEITPNNEGTWYNTPSLMLEINIVGRSTYCDIFSDNINLTESPIIEVPYDTQLNITSWYYDFESKEPLINANISLVGNNIDDSTFEFSEIGNRYQYLLNTSKIGLGTHLITVYLGKSNYEQSSQQIRIKVLGRDSYFDIFLNGINSTLSPHIDLEYNSTLNLTAQVYDSVTFDVVLDAAVTLTGASSSYRQISTKHEFIVDTTNFSIGIYYIFLVASSPKHLEYNELIEVQITPRSVNLGVFVDNSDYSMFTQVEVPITHYLNISGALYDSESGNIISAVTFSLVGLNSSQFSDRSSGSHYYFQLNTTEMGLGVHFITVLSQKANYAQFTKNFQIKIRPISTNITSQHYNSSYSLRPGEDFDLGVIVEDLDNGGLISGCLVEYQSSLGSGTLLEDENHVYTILLNNLPEGIHKIRITVYKGLNYKFDQFTITLNVISPPTDSIPSWAFYTMGIALAGLTSSFIAYQKYYKYPKIVRDIKKLKRSMKRGKSFNISTKSRKDLFMGSYIHLVKDILPGKVQGQLKSNISKGNRKSGFTTKSDVTSLVLPSGDTIAPYKAPDESPKITKVVPDTSKSPKTSPVLAKTSDVPKPSSDLVQNEENTIRLEKPHLKPDALTKKKPKDITFKHRPQIKELKPKSDK
ncbi:hypothetical protein [Candidatus Lokiarchaeum ossiferum]|uniref:hypothetical protein n=1 Tax=Candidatus Lokiarchaeum ossiferum TaxID=2951803 RepID=UPI00352C39B7